MSIPATKEASDIDLQAAFNQRLEQVERISKSSLDGVRFTLVLIINRWSIQACFEVLDTLLETTSDTVLNRWMANFTKVMVYSGNPQSSYIAPHLSIVSHNAQCAAVLIEENDKMPHFLRLLKPLKTSAVIDNFQHHHALSGELSDCTEQNIKNERAENKTTPHRYLLDVYNDSLRLEQLIVDCTHSYCEFILLNKVEHPLDLTLSLISKPARFNHGHNAYFRVIPNQSKTELILRAVLSAA